MCTLRYSELEVNPERFLSIRHPTLAWHRIRMASTRKGQKHCCLRVAEHQRGSEEEELLLDCG